MQRGASVAVGEETGGGGEPNEGSWSDVGAPWVALPTGADPAAVAGTMSRCEVFKGDLVARAEVRGGTVEASAAIRVCGLYAGIKFLDKVEGFGVTRDSRVGNATGAVGDERDPLEWGLFLCICSGPALLPWAAGVAGVGNECSRSPGFLPGAVFTAA